jgi:hypothetical chaperone protein
VPRASPSAGSWCAIDFGTSNSAVARVGSGPVSKDADRVELAALEHGATSMPTAVFYNSEDNSRAYGRAAMAAYVDGHEGRLMRSIKSILGSDLMEEATELPNGMQVRYLDVVVAYLRHLKQQAEAHWKASIERVVIGRPVFFVDDDPKRDARAQDTLSSAAKAAGIAEVQFQYEPIAAALDYESRLSPSDGERLVLVADIGGGTSDFSLVRTSAAAHSTIDRRADVLANHGVHIAGTDFDRRLNLATIMPVLGYGGVGPGNRPVPSKVYFDLATWHLINTNYAPKRMAELRLMRTMYDDQLAHARLMRVLERQRGHELSARAEAAKIAVSETSAAEIVLDFMSGPRSTSLHTPLASHEASTQADLAQTGDHAIAAFDEGGMVTAHEADDSGHVHIGVCGQVVTQQRFAFELCGHCGRATPRVKVWLAVVLRLPPAYGAHSRSLPRIARA